MKREKILIPKPRSSFLTVQCEKCSATTTVFSHTTANIKCSGCGELVAQSGGSKAKVIGKVVATLDQ
jgi:small subunit ribosomal protein S27e